MKKNGQRVKHAMFLIGLPLLSNVASFIIFAPLFDPNRNAVSSDFQRAGTLVGIAVLVIELAALSLIAMFLHREYASLKSIVNVQSGR
ncbi:MAG: hypothetical protein RTU92_04105 [Candidatus Thorarchaeota archaeon]